MNSIFKYSVIAAALIQAAAVLLFGWDLPFAYGLILGTCVSMVNHSLMAFTSNLCLSAKGGPLLGIAGYIVRLAIYGGVFYISYMTGPSSGMGTVLGFLTIKLAIYYLYGFKPGFSSRSYENVKLNSLD